MTSVPRDTTTRASDAIAGFLASAALFLGLFQIFYRPFRLAPVALILVLIATLMSRQHDRLIQLALAAVGIGFVLGAAIQVITHHPMF